MKNIVSVSSSITTKVQYKIQDRFIIIMPSISFGNKLGISVRYEDPTLSEEFIGFSISDEYRASCVIGMLEIKEKIAFEIELKFSMFKVVF